VLTPKPCASVGLLERGEEGIDFGDTGIGGGVDDDKTPNSSTARGDPSAALDPALLRLRPTNSSLNPFDLVRSARCSRRMSFIVWELGERGVRGLDRAGERGEGDGRLGERADGSGLGDSGETVGLDSDEKDGLAPGICGDGLNSESVSTLVELVASKDVPDVREPEREDVDEGEGDFTWFDVE